MNSLILRTTSRAMLPMLLLFSVFLLFRGHNDPGGGFVGGLVAAAAFVLHAVSQGEQAARRTLRVDPLRLAALGLLLALLSGTPSLLMGDAFMTTQWYLAGIPVLHAVGSPALFDTGVYLVVVGVVLAILFTLSETRAQ